MNFIIGLTKFKGKSVIMVVVNRLTKYAHFCVISHPFKASTISIVLVEMIQKLHGNPKIIVSDRDPIFTANFWTKLFYFRVLNKLISHLIILNLMGKLR